MYSVRASRALLLLPRLCLLCMAATGMVTAGAPARAAGAIAVSPKVTSPGQMVTLKWYFTASRIVVSGGRFGKGADVTGCTSVTDNPRKTTRYTFDVWYPDPKRPGAPKPTVHAQYQATAEVSDGPKGPSEEELVYQVLELVNRERASNRLPPLHLHPQLQSASRWMAQDMATNDYLDHTDHIGRELEARLAAFDYKDYQAIGENVAAGQTTAQAVMESWMESPGHRSNILSADFCDIGIGHFINTSSKFRHYWTQDFGRLMDSYPVVINNGAGITVQREVKLYIYGEGTIRQVRVSNDGTTWTEWENYQATRDWTLPSADGKHTVYVELKSDRQTFRSSESIELATVAPAVAAAK